MRASTNILMMLQSVWLNGPNVLMAPFRRQTCGFALATQVSGVASKSWQTHRKECNA